MIISNNATATSTYLRANATGYGLKETIGAEIDVNQNITTKLALNSTEQSKYYIYNGMHNKHDAKLLVGMDNVLIKSSL